MSEPGTGPAAQPRSAQPGSVLPRLVWRSLLTLLGYLLTGVLLGFLWHAFWRAPVGVAYSDHFLPVGEAGTRSFSATGSFVLWTLPAGFLLGLLLTPLLRGWEVLGLVVGLVGSLLASGTAALVGHLLGPPDPDRVARGAKDLTPVPAALDVAGWTPYLVLTTGALAAMMLVFVVLPTRRDSPRCEPAADG